MDDPTIIGGPAADRATSKLGDVMCVTGLAVDFYTTEKDKAKREKYLDIMKDAGKTAKLHYSTTHKVFMEHALLAKGLDFSTPAGRLCNPGTQAYKFLSKLIFKDIQLKYLGFCCI